MATTKRRIEVDAATAETLESRAAEQGLSVSQLLAELAEEAGSPVAVSDQEIAELDRRWQSVLQDGAIDHADVARWLQTWGTPKFKPWHRR